MCPCEEEEIAREMIIKKSGDMKCARARMYVQRNIHECDNIHRFISMIEERKEKKEKQGKKATRHNGIKVSKIPFFFRHEN